MGVYNVKAGRYNALLAEQLKNISEFKMPEWAAFVKTSVARERPPREDAFWYRRAASILRQLYLRGVVGVNRLRTRYGGRKKRGVKPEQFRKGSGKIIRVILQQAEQAGYVEKVKGKKAGRQLTKKGVELLKSIEDNQSKTKEESEEKKETKINKEEREEKSEEEKETKKEDDSQKENKEKNNENK